MLLVPFKDFMRYLNCAPFAVSLAAICSGCASLPNDQGGIMGNPTPALLAYAAQARFAPTVCSLGETKEAGDRFLRWGVEAALQLDYYRENIPNFSADMRLLEEKHSNTWATMDARQQADYCSAYQSDVRWSAEKWRLPLISVGDRFRMYFAPLSEARIERAKNASIVAGVLSLGFTAAGVNQASQNDFSSAQRFNAYGSAMTNSMGQPAASVNLPCKAYAPFTQMNQSMTAKDFATYYSLKECN